jgi:hypothetical protein
MIESWRADRVTMCCLGSKFGKMQVQTLLLCVRFREHEADLIKNPRLRLRHAALAIDISRDTVIRVGVWRAKRV